MYSLHAFMYLSLYLFLYFPGRQDGRVSGSAASFLSLTRGGRWRTSRDWSEDENENSKVGFIRDIQSDSQVRDEHLLLKPNQLVWLGATYQQVHQVLLNMFNINSAININTKSIVGLAKYHTQVLQSNLNILLF